MRKEIDDQYSRQYSGCLYLEPENPYMRSPADLMLTEWLCEAPSMPSLSVAKEKESNRRLSLLFDQGVGLGMAKQ